MGLTKLINQEERLVVPDKTTARLKNLKLVEVFPSNSLLNFYEETATLGLVFGSLMPAFRTTINVKNYILPDDKYFKKRYCQACTYAQSCPKGIKQLKESQCAYSDRQVGKRRVSQMTIDLPKIVILHSCNYKHYYLYAYYPTSEIKFRPLNLFNTYNDGSICWGSLVRPNSLKLAWNLFWNSPFNLDLTPFKFKINYDMHMSAAIVKHHLTKCAKRISTAYPQYKLLSELTKENVLLSNAAVLADSKNVLPAEYLNKQAYFIQSNKCYYTNVNL